MDHSKLRGGRLLVTIGIALLTISLLGRIAAQAYIEILWFNSVGYSSVFWTRFFWEWGVQLIGGLFVGVAFFFNLRVIARALGGIRIKRQVGDLVISEQIPENYVVWGIGVFSVLGGAWFAASIPGSMGLDVLFLLNAPEWGVTDPILGRDLTFFVLRLPLLRAAAVAGLVVSFLIFTLSAAGYAGTGALQWGQGRLVIEDRPRKHLGVIAAVFFAVLAGQFYVFRYVLLLNGSSGVQGIFGFTDAGARMLAYNVLAVLALAVSAAALWTGFKNRLLPLMVTFGLLIVGGLAVGQVYPSFVQRFRVEPNELERESEYILENMRFTKMGFDLTDLERREFDYERTPNVDWLAAAAQFEGLPIWSSQALLTTYRQLEARYPYYEFSGVTVDRYESLDGLVPVTLAVREVLPRGIQDQNWQNLHLRDEYIRGMGAVVSAATDRTPEGRPSMFVSGIPPEFSASDDAPLGVNLTRPEVYIGIRPQEYAIVDPVATGDAAGVDRGEQQPGVDFPAGIQLDSPLRRLALAWRFRDWNLLIAGEVNRSSRFVFRRDVLDRVTRISGQLLRFPEAPYPVIHEGRIVWILEGFTWTSSFPLSTLQDLEAGRAVRYVRNSVKITIDGVTGEVNFYIVDDVDPLLQAYAQGLPGLFRPLSDMPGGLRDHIRYPRSMLSLQARVLYQYHQETSPLFHGQQDVWTLPQELAQGTTPVPYQPEYGLYRLPGEEESDFLLTSVFVPRGRQNLTAILTASSDPDRYGELVLFDVPVEDQVPGPRQVEALIEQDPVISQQFSLWRTGGSQVWTGHLHLVPVGRTLLYMEPVFLAAEEDAIPDLTRFVVSDGYRVAMEETLQESIQALARIADASAPDLIFVDGPLDLPSLDTDQWPAEALALLEAADAALRTGDFQGFGDALDELRALLERLSTGPTN
ncbi:MAG: hypothetical protein CME12_00570 [Gemmatimonadetes bacterium]|nr:hypothetical protein [Gemmatimonadota bacterium]